MTRKNVKIPIEVLELVPSGIGVRKAEQWKSSETKASLEVEDNKVVISLKIKKFSGNYHAKQKWDRRNREYFACDVESSPITFLHNKKQIKIIDLTIVWKDEKNEITNIEDYFLRGTEIKLKLTKNPEESEENGKIDWNMLELGDWKEEGNEIFSLCVYSNYEIITPTKTISFANSFPILETETPKPKKDKSMVSKQEILNNLNKTSVLKLKTVEYPNFLEEPTKFELEESELQEIKKTLIENVIKKNPQDWKISEELEVDLGGVIKSGKKTILLVHENAKLERSAYGSLKTDCGKIHHKKGFTEEEWKEIENILKESEEIQEKNPNNGKNVGWLGIILAIILLIGWWIVRKLRII